jgi:hypothetical protein
MYTNHPPARLIRFIPATSDTLCARPPARRGARRTARAAGLALALLLAVLLGNCGKDNEANPATPAIPSPPGHITINGVSWVDTPQPSGPNDPIVGGYFHPAGSPLPEGVWPADQTNVIGQREWLPAQTNYNNFIQIGLRSPIPGAFPAYYTAMPTIGNDGEGFVQLLIDGYSLIAPTAICYSDSGQVTLSAYGGVGGSIAGTINVTLIAVAGSCPASAVGDFSVRRVQ